MLITRLLLVLAVCNVKSTYRKSWARNLLIWSDFTLGFSFKVKLCLNGFGEFSFRWIQFALVIRCDRSSSFWFLFLCVRDLTIFKIFGKIQTIFWIEKMWKFKASIFKCMSQTGVVVQQILYFGLMNILFIITFKI